MITTGTDISIVAAQLTCWALIVILADFERLLTTPLFFLIALGLGIVISSAIQLGRSYSSSTKPQPRNVFVQKGFYRYLRHPIYTGMIFLSFVFLLTKPTLIAGLAFLLIILISNARAGLEEQMLTKRYPEYAAYRKRTKRFIPFLV